MRWWLVALAVTACGKDKGQTGETGVTSDADTDADSDSDTDSDTDADADPPTGTGAVRFVNAAPEFGVAYLFVGADTEPLLGVPAMFASPWGPFDAGALDFVVVPTGGTKEDGAPVAITVADKSYTTMWVAGTKDAPVVGAELQDDAGIPVGYVRYLVHDAVVGSATIGLEAAAIGAASTLAIGDSVALDGPAEGFTVTADLDGDGAADWTFDLASLAPGSYVPLFVTWDDGALVALGASPLGGSSVLTGTEILPTTTGGGTGDTGP